MEENDTRIKGRIFGLLNGVLQKFYRNQMIDSSACYFPMVGRRFANGFTRHQARTRNEICESDAIRTSHRVSIRSSGVLDGVSRYSGALNRCVLAIDYQ